MNGKTIVFKVGTSSLTQPDGSLDRIKLARITRQLAQIHQQGYRVVLVSSGSIAAGFRRLGFSKRPTHIPEKQASAAVGQGLLIEEYTKNLMMDGIVSAQVLLTQNDFSDPRRYQNAARSLNVLLKQNTIPIINENDTVAIEELKVGDNDTLSAQVASLLRADLLVLLTDVDGLYTANPNHDPDAKHIPVIHEINEDLFQMAAGAGSSNATGGMTTKLLAAQIATKSGVPVFICSSEKDTALIEAVNQDNKGTLFQSDETSLNQREQWMAFYAKVHNSVEIDEGASIAMREGGGSLLAAGVTKINGDFNEEDIIEVYSSTDHQLVGKGRTRMNSEQLSDIIYSEKPMGIVIHRNDWVTLG